jgi:hypothetical protein
MDGITNDARMREPKTTSGNWTIGDAVVSVRVVRVKKRQRRAPVMDLRRKGVCHFEIAGTGQIVKARKDCPHREAKFPCPLIR